MPRVNLGLYGIKLPLDQINSKLKPIRSDRIRAELRELSAFRLGDIRGIYPDEVNERFVSDFGHAFVGHFGAVRCIATGRDTRRTGESLQSALNETLAEIGIHVIDMGVCATEVGYHASAQTEIDAVIIVTASHNPPDYNGLKCVLSDGQTVSADTGLDALQALMSSGYRHRSANGLIESRDLTHLFQKHLIERFNTIHPPSQPVLLNGLNGTAGMLADGVSQALNLDVDWLNKEPGPLPAGGADPVSEAMTIEMRRAMSDGRYGLGIAWDGDSDRCAFYDEAGHLVPTYYLVGLLAEYFLERHAGAAIVFDAKLHWNTLDVIERYHGKPVVSRTGHAFMKACMRDSAAVYGGELSSHHYFGEFHGCDSGMYAWLVMLELLAQRGETLASLVHSVRQRFSCTPEISMSLTDVDGALEAVAQHISGSAIEMEPFEGVGAVMPGDWRFSLIPSKTEPLVRLNFESRGNPENLLASGRQIFDVLAPYRADDADWERNFCLQ